LHAECRTFGARSAPNWAEILQINFRRRRAILPNFYVEFDAKSARHARATIAKHAHDQPKVHSNCRHR
jgi:hypothetical protein